MVRWFLTTAAVRHYVAFEIRRAAGPSSIVQCVLSGGPYTHSVTGAAMPARMSATAVPKAGDVADEDLGWRRGGSRWGIGWALRSPICLWSFGRGRPPLSAG